MEQPTNETLQPATGATHRAGFVNIVGNPNVGKSTLSNRLVGERLSIITSKAQTTRHRIMGIVNGTGALVDADVLLYVTDVVETPTKNKEFLDKVAREKIPILLVINKIDLLKGNDDLLALIDRWKQLLPGAEVFPTSATENFNVDNLMARIVELLPVSPPYFGKDALTDRSARFFVTEIIREKILLTYDKEVPYATQVIVEKYTESDHAIHIMAVIYVERDSQKGIIIGHQGRKLKHVGIEARKDIEKFFDKKVYLELYVKVENDWRNQENKLRAFGYIE